MICSSKIYFSLLFLQRNSSKVCFWLGSSSSAGAGVEGECNGGMWEGNLVAGDDGSCGRWHPPHADNLVWVPRYARLSF